MEYSVEQAKRFLGKRIVVSLRHVNPQGEDVYSGLWGIVVNVSEGGMLLKVEGGIDDEFWMMPPDFGSIVPAQEKYYQMEGYDDIVESVDYEAYWAIADDPNNL
jgi:hypothetical protein